MGVFRDVSEDDVRAAYDAAEVMVRSLIEREDILIPDYRVRAKEEKIAHIARAVADAVIRSQYEHGDIGDLIGIGFTVSRNGNGSA